MRMRVPHVDRCFHLNGHAARRYILQIPYPPLFFPGEVTPDQLDQIRAEEARVLPTFLHRCHTFSSADQMPVTMRMFGISTKTLPHSMEFQPDLSARSTGPDTRLGIVLRVAFFVATVFVGLRLLVFLLFTVFGLVVAGTVGLCAAGLAANLLTLRIFDRRPLTDIGLKGGRISILNFALGLLVGVGAAGLMMLAPILAGSGHLVEQPNPVFSWPNLLFYLITLAVAAAGEEMIFRGYAFQLLVDKIGPFATLLPVSVIFGLTHASNPHSTAIGVLNTVLWGVVLGFAFLRSRDLWLPIGLHFGWNAVLPLFGVNLSGLNIEVTRFQYRWDLLPLWSGGDYGPEGGLLATIFVIGVFFTLLKIPVKAQHAAIARNLNEPA